ncbi:MAG: DNA integrity scanning protein DisA nucleotide-binding domain protein [Bacilli bacterium]|nr:DNA integrity scanning protein DisA nucleotide-binding domain protein [Bacilli bacterium]
MVLSGLYNLWPSSFEDYVANWHNIWFIIDVTISLALAILLSIGVLKILKSKRTSWLFVSLLVLAQLAVTLNMIVVAVTLAVIILVLTILIVIVSSSEIKSVLRDEMGWTYVLKTKKNNNVNRDYHGLCETIESAVIEMSRQKCGALITFERDDRLTTDRFARWNDIEAQVTEEILKTIFYKGSPLHDGATIIREGKIIRAGVIFDSVSVSTAAMPGSLGSRHRAALGITETCDCVSVTVSEETGSIHICENGHITKCYVSNFKEKLLDLLSER